jgi:serine protease AprX
MVRCHYGVTVLPYRLLFLSRSVRRCLAAAFLFSVLVSALLLKGQARAYADALTDKCAPALRHSLVTHPRAKQISVIAKLTGNLSSVQKRQLKALGGDVYRHLPLIQAVALQLPARHLSRLAALPFILHLSEDAPVQKNDEFTVASSGADVAHQQYGLTGQGVTVAVLDSGIFPHLDLKNPATGQSRILANVEFVSGSSSNDQYGHGTHVAGILAGNGASSTGGNHYRTFLGIAPRANLVNVRVLDMLGNGTSSGVIAGIQWVVQHKATYNIRVINLSLGHAVTESYTTDPLCLAVEQAWKAGIVVVCAAGNGGRSLPLPLLGVDNEGYGNAYETILSPGNNPYVISVGAMKSMDGIRAHDRIATYSSRGPSARDWVVKPDIVAPGTKVISLHYTGSLISLLNLTHIVPPSAYMIQPPLLAPSAYFQMSGTSMAAPVVSGAVALLLQANPNLSPDTIKLRLMTSADKWLFPDETMDVFTFGAGYLNIPAALNSPVVASGYALSPTLTYDEKGRLAFDLNTLIWGTLAVWGLQPDGGTQALWTDFNPSKRSPPPPPEGSSIVISLPLLDREH